MRIIPTVKLGDKKWLDCEQPGNSEPFSVTKLPVYFTNSEQPCISEQFCIDQKVSYYQVSFTKLSLILVIMKSKVHISWEGHEILQNLHLTFDWHYIGQD